MHRQPYPGTLRLLGIVCAAALLVAPSAFGQQPLRATVVHIEGVGQPGSSHALPPTQSLHASSMARSALGL
jgi:hypothetical protein